MAALAEALAALSVLLATAALGLRPRRAQRLRAALRLLAGEPEAAALQNVRASRRRAVLPAALTARVEAAGLDWSDEAVILALMAGLAVGYVAGQLLVGTGVLPWLITAAGALLPFVYWGHRAELRRREMQREASEAVRALSRAVTSGLPLHQALRRFAQRNPGLLAAEVGAAIDAVETLGTPLEAALDRVRRRLPFPEVALVVALLRATGEGARLGRCLHDLALTLDARAEALGKARTILGEPRQEALAVAFAPAVFALVLHLWAPVYFRTLTTGAGQLVLAGALVGGVPAFVLIRRTTTVHDRF